MVPFASAAVRATARRISKISPPRQRPTFATAASATSSKPLAGKVVTVTGAARGIGLATAKLLAARGATVAISDLVKDNLAQARQQIQDTIPDAKIETKVVDVTKPQSIEEWLKDIKQRLGQIDGAVNNAGVVKVIPIATTTDEQWDEVVNVNLTGTFNTLRALFPLISDGGSIVNLSSVAGLYGVPGLSAYCATKHAVLGLTKVAAKELASKKVRVNAVCPGTIGTIMMDQINTATNNAWAEEHTTALLGRYGTPEEIAALIAFLISDESSFTNGSAYSSDGGWTVA